MVQKAFPSCEAESFLLGHLPPVGDQFLEYRGLAAGFATSLQFRYPSTSLQTARHTCNRVRPASGKLSWQRCLLRDAEEP